MIGSDTPTKKHKIDRSRKITAYQFENEILRQRMCDQRVIVINVRVIIYN